MSVLIKGMEMPTSCWVCPCECDYSHCGKSVCGITAESTLENRENRRDDCPLIPVPPHGRLIDADNLRRLYDPTDYELDVMSEDYFYRCHVAIPVIQQNIDDMPTIIPADETV